MNTVDTTPPGHLASFMMDHDDHLVRGQKIREMLQRPSPNAFSKIRRQPKIERPVSVITEFVDTDWDEEVVSDVEDNSRRLSLQSSGQPSFTTVSSYDEVATPGSSKRLDEYPVCAFKQVQGPRGPHLFESFTDASLAVDDHVLTLSPVSPKPHYRVAEPQLPRGTGYQNDEMDSPTFLVSWTPEMIAQFMLDAGIEQAVANRFVENDISGGILLTLKFEDLKELDIPSFGIRTRVWRQILALRDSLLLPPRLFTPSQDTPCYGVEKEDIEYSEHDVHRRRSGRRRPRHTGSVDEDMIWPLDSVSIIGIEQLIPKIHECSKGGRCTKWRRQQKILGHIKKLRPAVDVKDEGTIMIYGDAGNPKTARAIDPDSILRPVSDVGPSVVASSDVLGPSSLPPLQYLRESALKDIQARDPQENVRQFLEFQQKSSKSDRVPPTPPFELTPSSRPAHPGLRQLPKLFIPSQTPQPPIASSCCSSASQTPEVQETQLAQSQPTTHSPERDFVPYRMKKAAPLSPELEDGPNIYRFGTPFSEVDVPVTAVPIGPVARNVSQSVPPDMNYRASPSTNAVPQRPRATFRRPSFPVLPVVSEGVALCQPSLTSLEHDLPRRQQQQKQQQTVSQTVSQTVPQTHVRFSDPSPPLDRAETDPVVPSRQSFVRGKSQDTKVNSNGTTCQGPMKKRRTRLLRHEWQDGFFTLKGTRLNMHKDAHEVDRTLEYIDIDDYAIACSSLASTSKLSAAFKAVHISHNRQKSDPVAAFSFQLIPQDRNAGSRLRKRGSSISGALGGGALDALNGTGKTHHFAVQSRDERIDWMRELMLAKAMKQKGDGFEISVNGNMI